MLRRPRPMPSSASGPTPTPRSGSPSTRAASTHFDYVNPDAPKGGTLYLRNPDRRTSFDKFNYFTTKGSAPAGI